MVKAIALKKRISFKPVGEMERCPRLGKRHPSKNRFFIACMFLTVAKVSKKEIKTGLFRLINQIAQPSKMVHSGFQDKFKFQDVCCGETCLWHWYERVQSNNGQHTHFSMTVSTHVSSGVWRDKLQPSLELPSQAVLQATQKEWQIRFMLSADCNNCHGVANTLQCV